MSEQTEDATIGDVVEDEQLQKIKDKKGEKFDYTELHVNRVPDKTVQKLKDVAYDRFAGDYGMAIAYAFEIVDVREEVGSKLESTNREVLELRERVLALEQKLVEAAENEAEDDEEKVDTLQ